MEKTARNESMNRRQRGEMAQSKGFGRQRPYTTELRGSLLVSRRLLKFITKAFATEIKLFFQEPISDFTSSSVRSIIGNVVSVMCAFIEYM